MGTVRKQPAWYREWFGKEYLALYRHRDEKQAREEVAFVGSLFSTPGLLLDVACGGGRHLSELILRGFDGYGLDLSETLLEQATRACPGRVTRGDMLHLPLRESQFDYVTNFFTSFGYFDDDSLHLQTLREWNRVLRPSGRFLLDYLNPEVARQALVPVAMQTIGDREIKIEKSIEEGGKRLVKKIFFSGETAPPFVESVRLFALEELTSLAMAAGFTVEHTFGSFAGDAVTKVSPRLILVGTKQL